MRYLLDTCIISELVAKQPNPKVLSWVTDQPDENLYLSVITIGEIKKGVCKLPDSKRKSALSAWLRQDLLVRFAGRVQAVDIETMLYWGELLGRLETQGRALPLLDSLIAAIALRGSFQLVTRNEKDFDRIGVSIVNPFVG